MITQLKLGDTNLIAVKLKGRVREKEVLSFMESMMKEVEQRESLNLYVELVEVGPINYEGFSKGLKIALEHLQILTERLRKIAIVTDNDLIRRITGVEDILISAIEERAFLLSEKEKAINWIINK